MMSRFRKALIFAVVILVVVIAAAFKGYFYWEKSTFKNTMPHTTGGVLFEQMLPPNPLFVVSYNPTDEAQRKEFTRILDVVFQDQKKALPALFVSEFEKKIEKDLAETTDQGKKEVLQKGLEFLREFYHDRARFTLAMGGEFPFAELMARKKFSKDHLKNLDIYILSEVKDGAAQPERLEKVQKLLHWMFEEKINEMIAEKDIIPKKFYTGILGDVGYITTEDPERLKARFAGKESSFAGSDAFYESGKTFQRPFLGYTFSGYTTPQSPERFSGTTMHATPEGFTIKGVSFIDQKKLKGSTAEFFFKPYTAALYKKIPVEKPLLFAEFSSVADFIKLGEAENVRQGLPAQDFSDFKQQTGFDFKEDILPFLDRGMVMVIDDSGKIMPFISFYFDVASAPEKAQTVMKKMDSSATTLVPLMNLDFMNDAKMKGGGGKPLVELIPLSGMKVGRTAKVYFSRIPKDQVDILLLDAFPDPVEFSYGITHDNLLFFSMTPNFEKTFFAADKKTIESNDLFVEVLKNDVKPGWIIIFDVRAGMDIASRFVNLMEKYRGFSEEEKKGFELIKKYTAPIQGFAELVQKDGSTMSAAVLVKVLSQ